jgi:hypothetical protein
MTKKPRKKKFTIKVQAEICKEIVMLISSHSDIISMTSEDIFIILTELCVSFAKSISTDDGEFKENVALLCAGVIAMSGAVSKIEKPHDGVVH